MKQVQIPKLEELEEISQRNGFCTRLDADLQKEFEVFNLDTESGFICLMTAELDLFSIDIMKPNDRKLLETLAGILELYGLPAANLTEDIVCCVEKKEELNRDYEAYWVQYFLNEEDPNVMYVRYRAFVDESCAEINSMRC